MGLAESLGRSGAARASVGAEEGVAPAGRAPATPVTQGAGRRDTRATTHSVPGRCHGPPIITSPAWCNSPTRQTRTRERSPCCVLEDTPLRASTPLKGQRNPHPGVPGTEPASPRTPPPGRHCGPPAWGRDPTTSDLRTAPSGGPGANEGLEGVGLEPEDPAQPDLDCPVPPRPTQSAPPPRVCQTCPASRRCAPACPCGLSRRTGDAGPGCPTPRSGPPASAPLRSR